MLMNFKRLSRNTQSVFYRGLRGRLSSPLRQNIPYYLITLSICLFLLCSTLSATAFNAPTYQGYVTDPGRVLSVSQKQSLENLSGVIKRKTGAQVATAIIPKMGENWTIEEYANRLFEAWGIGQKGQDNGILFLVALKEKKLRIEVGYGLEEFIPDGKAGAIRDEFILPYFKEGRFQDGIVSGHFAIASIVAESFNVQLTASDVRPRGPSQGRRAEPVQMTSGQSIIMLLIMGLIILGMIKSPTFRAFMFGMLIASAFSRGGYRRSSMGHFGGGSGFGGFGGGLSGGGGASGGW